MTALLVVDGARVHFGGLHAVDGVSVAVAPNQVVGLIGPNGAGKTTLFNAISGHVALTAGTVKFRGEDVTALPPHDRARLGIARTFQLGGLIDDLTAAENVVLGLDHAVRIGRPQLPRAELLDAAGRVLDRLDLRAIAGELAGSLPMGLRRQVEVLRAIAAQPHLVLLDEPGAGLTQEERRHLAQMVRFLASEHSSFVITDHSTDLLFAVSDAVLAMNFGRQIAYGTPDTVRRDPQVVDAYLGGEAA